MKVKTLIITVIALFVASKAIVRFEPMVSLEDLEADFQRMLEE